MENVNACSEVITEINQPVLWQQLIFKYIKWLNIKYELGQTN